MKYWFYLCLICSAPLSLAEQNIDIHFSLPAQQSSEYRRPYVAIWVESEGKLVRNLALWINEDDWLKDLRKWWRKSGRYLESSDAFSGATRKPGNYRISWDRRDSKGQLVADGQYQIMLEAAREYGGRSVQKQVIQLGIDQNIQRPLTPGTELGEGYIKIGEKP